MNINYDTFPDILKPQICIDIGIHVLVLLDFCEWEDACVDRLIWYMFIPRIKLIG